MPKPQFHAGRAARRRCVVQVVTPVLAAALAACGGSPAGKPAAATAKLDSSSAVTFKNLFGQVKNVKSARPACPVIPHFEAELTVTHLSGTLTYRWERSAGKTSDTREAAIPPAAATGSADMTLAPDEWLQTDAGVQMNHTNRVHVLSPIDRLSPPIEVAAKCY